eukprot:166415-Lingulodinium_polyedra.AAC.1
MRIRFIGLQQQFRAFGCVAAYNHIHVKNSKRFYMSINEHQYQPFVPSQVEGDKSSGAPGKSNNDLP